MRVPRRKQSTSPPGPLSTSGEGEPEKSYRDGRAASPPGPLSIGWRGGTGKGHDPALVADFAIRNRRILKPSDVLDLFEITGVKPNHIPGNHQHHKKINCAGRPLHDRVKFARAFLLIIIVQPAQR